MSIKKKVTVKLSKPKDSNKCVNQKKKVIAKLFKRKHSNKCVFQKKKMCSSKKKGYCETF